MSNVENVGTITVMYTVEPDLESEERAIVTFWMQNGVKIGSMNVARDDIKK